MTLLDLFIILFTAACLLIAVIKTFRPLNFDSAIPHKGGHNDLSRWEAFGGSLKRPDAPSPISDSRRRRPF